MKKLIICLLSATIFSVTSADAATEGAKTETAKIVILEEIKKQVNAA